tara:strand:- start:81 stop:1355 length:1275 start_codon:yes stop_codon:yes gene_type:complete
MAGKSNNNATLFAQKKLLNKAHTSVLKSDAQETITTNIQPAAQTTFGVAIPANPNKSLYLIQSASAGKPGSIEYVQFDIETISGTSYDGNAVDSGAGPEPSNVGPHGYALVMTGNYESLSPNSKAGQGIFDNGKVLSGTLGQIQIIPPVFSTDRPNPYSVTLYKGDPSNATNVIPLESEIDYQLDTFNGILFVQDYDAANVPLFARAFIYVGDMVDTVIENSGGGAGGPGDKNAEYLVLAATGSLTNERVFSPTTGLISQDSGAGNNYTLRVDNSVVATLTGSVFTGNSLFQSGLSGSLQQLVNGTPYLRSGTGISITTGSSGEVTVSSTGTSGLVRSKDVFFVTSSYSAGTSYNVYEPNFPAANYEFDKIDVFLNGQLMHSGTQVQVSSGQRDYYIESADSLKFSFSLEVDDILDVVVFSVSS